MEEVKGKMEDCHTDSELLTQFHKNTPQLRFSGFYDEWEEKNLGDIVTEFKNPVELPHNGYTRLGIRSHAKGTFHEYVAPGHELEAAQMSEVKADNLIMSITFAWEHAVAITDKNDEGKLVSQRFPQFRFNKGQVPKFYKYVIADEKFRHHLWLSSPGGAGRNRVLNIKESMEYKTSVPTTNVEQQKIGAFLSHIDSLIQTKTKKLESLKAVKKSLLQKCFPKVGEKVPEMRFAGFSGDWEESSATKLFQTVSDKGHPELPVLSASQELGMIYREDFKSDIQYNTQNTFGYKRVCPKQFVIHLRSFQGGFAHSKIEGITSPAYTILKLCDENNHDDIFWKYVLTSESFIKTLETIIYGIRDGKSISFDDFSTLVFIYPSSKNEQQKIGQFFSKYDSLISAQQKEIDKLKNIKKSLLQKMFI